MAETIPILLNGEKKGTLTVTREGLMTVFNARCEDPGRMVRLSVYGPEGEGYLGVMVPGEGALTLRRRLSRSAMGAFPSRFDHAGEAGRAPSPEPRPSPEAAEPSAAPARPTENARGATARGQGQREGGPRERRGREPDVLWHPVGDGSLYTRRGEEQLRAIPLANQGRFAGKEAERRTIEGVEYAVYRLKNGRIQ